MKRIMMLMMIGAIGVLAACSNEENNETNTGEKQVENEKEVVDSMQIDSTEIDEIIPIDPEIEDPTLVDSE